ncbi:hypothetical protein TSUD_399390 [Trifolium subterraneum]|uniref:RNase H type-1 domain-containing protein n=1 Tax=Trifolium subterraneum TaxID=3900 RepID=A0A2Z6NJ11_TRISU|nr:hypothetical protein TSUD_399390 [Trifolium subterraneum]
MAANHGTLSLQTAVEEIRSLQRKVTTMEKEQAEQNADSEDESLIESQPLRQSLWDSKVLDNFKTRSLQRKVTTMEKEQAEQNADSEDESLIESQPLRQSLWDSKVLDNFKSPHLPTFDGKTDPVEHLMARSNNYGVKSKPGDVCCSFPQRFEGEESNTKKRSRDAKEKDLKNNNSKGQSSQPQRNWQNNDTYKQGYRTKPYYPPNGGGGMSYPQHRRYPADREYTPLNRKSEGDGGNKGEKHRVAVNTISGGFAGGGESNSAIKPYVRRSRFEICSVGNSTFPHTPEISFNLEDRRDVVPHDDDPLDAYKAMRLSDEQLNPYYGTLVGFAGEQVNVIAHVTLYTTFGEGENAKTLRNRRERNHAQTIHLARHQIRGPAKEESWGRTKSGHHRRRATYQRLIRDVNLHLSERIPAGIAPFRDPETEIFSPWGRDGGKTSPGGSSGRGSGIKHSPRGFPESVYFANIILGWGWRQKFSCGDGDGGKNSTADISGRGTGMLLPHIPRLSYIPTLMDRVFAEQIGKNLEVYIDDMLNPAKCSFGVQSGKFLGFLLTHRGIEANPDKCQAIINMRSPTSVKEVQQLTGRIAALSRFLSCSGEKACHFFFTLRKSERFTWSPQCEEAFQKSKDAKRSRNEISEDWEVVSSHGDNGSKAETVLLEPSSEFDITYMQRGAIKSQALANFVLELTYPPSENEAQPWTLSVDSSSNLRDSGAGVVLEGPEGVIIEQSLRFAFKAINNQAEYEALIAGMKLTKEMEVQELKVQSDSQLVANQVAGEFQTKDPQLAKYLEKFKEMVKYFITFELTYVPREQNARADLLAKLARMVIEEEDWRSPIIRYLQRDVLPLAKDEATRIRKMAAWYTMVWDKLYKRGFSAHMLLCVSDTEASRILNEIYEGSCESHIGSKSLAGKVMRDGFYWPNLHDDATRHVRTCDKCQRYSNLHHAPGEPLKSVLSPWLFYMWGVDILGPLSTSSARAKWIIVVVDYFTKWVEAELVSVEHPQANGQAESANKITLRALKRRINSKQESWVEHLPGILWSYHTTPQSSTGEPPFTMVYGADVMIPVEIQPSTWRRDTLTLQENNTALEESLDLLSGLREKAHFREFYIKQRAARKYNTRVIPRKFKEDDLVLKRPMGRVNGGKLAANWEIPVTLMKTKKETMKKYIRQEKGLVIIIDY